MTQKGTIRDHIRAAFVENLGLKVLSLGCAVALWAFTQGPETAARTFSVNIVSDMPPEEAKRQLITPLPSEVAVTLRGSRSQLAELHADGVGPLRLNLRGGRDAKIDLEESMFNIPAGLTVEQIVPTAITVKWDDVITKALRVEVPRTGEPASGFTVKGAVISAPFEVQAKGPRSIVDVMHVARAAPFDVTGLGGGVHTLKLPLDRPTTTLVTYDPMAVTATVEIARLLVTKTFSKLKVEVIGPARATTRPATVTVVVQGTTEDLGSLTAEAIVPRVEPKAAGHDVSKAGNDNLPVLVDLPRGVNAQIDPPKVVATW
jgi:hypothetical protein